MKAQLLDKSDRWEVARRHCNKYGLRALLSSPIQKSLSGLSGVAIPPKCLKDCVSNLSSTYIVRRSMKSALSNHGAILFANYGSNEPASTRRTLFHSSKLTKEERVVK